MPLLVADLKPPATVGNGAPGRFLEDDDRGGAATRPYTPDSRAQLPLSTSLPT